MAEIESTSNSNFAAAIRERDHWRLRYKELEVVDEHLNEECKQLRAEVERLRRDAGRYRWLVSCNPQAVSAIAYNSKAACRHPSADPDLCIDAAVAAKAKGDE